MIFNIISSKYFNGILIQLINMTPLHLAVKNSHIDVICHLLSRKEIDVNIKTILFKLFFMMFHELNLIQFQTKFCSIRFEKKIFNEISN